MTGLALAVEFMFEGLTGMTVDIVLVVFLFTRTSILYWYGEFG